MSIVEVTTRISKRWLMRKSKDELASIIMANIDHIDLFSEEYGQMLSILEARGRDAEHIIGKYQEDLRRIGRVACGEDQLEDHEAIDDTEALGWIYKFTQKCLLGTVSGKETGQRRSREESL
jgi:hypothetical protein